ncbi:MAG: DUF4878 domain-containing protein [Thermoflavifilum aggregans]|nr:DUF4878 domain-containing protein [Thermoflavifilum aggregans]
MKTAGVACVYAGLFWLIGISSWGCHAHKSMKPDEVASSFMYALQHAHYDSAKYYATKDSYEMIDLVASIAESTPQGKKKIQQSEIVVQKVFIQGDSGYVTYLNKTAHTTETFPLVLEAGKWKIRFAHQLPVPDSNGTEQILPPADTSNP